MRHIIRGRCGRKRLSRSAVVRREVGDISCLVNRTEGGGRDGLRSARQMVSSGGQGQGIGGGYRWMSQGSSG